MPAGSRRSTSASPWHGAGRPSPRTAGLIGARAPARLAARGPRSTKFSSGAVLVVGGSTGLTGAVCLSAMGAMRAGAGWVRVGVPASLNPIFEVKLTEVMSVPLADENGSLTTRRDGRRDGGDRAGRCGRAGTRDWAGRRTASRSRSGLAERIEKPLLVDADGLNAIAESGLEGLAGRDGPTILTPHAGELGRLLGRPSADVEAHRLAAAREAAQRSGAIVVLKGDDTLVVEPAGLTGVSMGGSPGARDSRHRRRPERHHGCLPCAGTRSVRGGLYGGQGSLPTPDAARPQALGAGSMIAGDVVDALPAVMRRGSGTDGDSKLTGMAELTVGDVMERDPVTIAPDADLETLLRMLRENELPGLPVVDGDRLVGIVTESDLVLQGDDTSLHLPHYFQLFGGVVFLEPLQHLEDRIRKAFANSVSDMMTTDVETISPDATVHEAARMISSSGHNRVPVVEGDRLVGVVTRVDALEALTREG